MALLLAASVVTDGGGHTRHTAKVHRVGALFNRGPNLDDIDLLRKGLAERGYVEGTNLVIEARFAEGQLDRLPGFAAELVAAGVDVIAAYGGPPTSAARKATTTIPIVAALVADPVALGFAETLQRPGGNVTGITNHDAELATLQLGLLRQVLPALTRVAFLSDADIPGADASGLAPIERANVAAAKAMHLTPQMLKLRGPAPDFGAAFDAMVAARADALVVLEVPVPFANRERIAELAAVRRLPTMFWGGAANAGGLMAYGTSFADTYPRMPEYVDRMLKGAKPADTPFEVITRRVFVVNLTSARRLGVTIPREVLARADRVIG